jgi:alkyl hydroperoxide reductase subunit AhpF
MLQVYVSSGCENCRRAREISASLSRAYPGIAVQLIDVDSIGAGSLPDEVIAVPTYVLDGVVVSLGNPNLVSLREKLAAVALAKG